MTDTRQLILDTEAKVALQWAKTKGNALAHSNGFSFRRPDGQPCKPLSPVASSDTLRIVRPTRREKPSVRGSSIALALLILLFLGLGIGYAAQSVTPAGPEANAPLMW